MATPGERAVTVDPMTLVPVYLECFATGGTTPMATATGFFVHESGRHALITNWHVVTGRHPETGNALSDTGHCDPDMLKMWMHDEGNLGRWWGVNVRIRNEDGGPLWFEHPAGRGVDVVAVPAPSFAEVNAKFPPGAGVRMYPIDMSLAHTNLLVRPSEQVSIVGFPGGNTVIGKFPIWKTGAVASDVDLDYAGKPCFLIDATTGPGMSGSPVVARRMGTYFMKTGHRVTNTTSPETNRFMGIYSGRVGTNLPDTPIGIVWKPHVISEIIASR
jgi:hypothetical protein